ncbi:MAG: hypothetical protein WAT71_10625 [Ignavibacteria bacterium]
MGNKRKKKKNKLRKKIKGRKKLTQQHKPYSPTKMKFFQIPNPMDGIPMEERRKVIREMGIKAETDFQIEFPKLQDWFRKYDALYLLSFCAVYFLSNPEGTNPEVRDGHLDFYHHYLELLQAFALTMDRNVTAKPLQEDASELEKVMKKVSELMSMRGFAIPDGISENELHKYYVIQTIRNQTAAVRNSFYPFQIKRYYSDILSNLVSEFENYYGLNPVTLIDCLEKMGEELNNKLNIHLNKVRQFFKEKNYKKIFEAYHSAFPDTVKGSEEEQEKLYEQMGKNPETLKASLVAHSDLKLESIFTFTVDEIAKLYGDETNKEKIQSIFDLWSIKFGDLKDRKYEHFILDNPVLKQPFVAIADGKYYCGIMGILFHFIPIIIEGLITNIGQGTKEKYERIRAKYLEKEVEKLFRNGFPDSLISSNNKWTDDVTGQIYENDLLLTIDNFCIVVECKAGYVDPPARRGAELRLIDTFEDLILKPSQQANRIIEYLKTRNGISKFTDGSGKEIEIDSSKIKYFIPLSITFEQLGSISANLKQIIEAGFIDASNPLVPSISLGDLEIIFELLETQLQKIHYFLRRSQIEKNMDYYADELDLLAFYINNAFAIGEAEFDHIPMNLNTMFGELEYYYLAKQDGVTVLKPAMKFSKWWSDILNVIEKKKIGYWVETGCILLSIQNKDQETFEKRFKHLLEKVATGKAKNKYNWLSLQSGPERRKFIIVGFPYFPNLFQNKEDRNSMIAGILEKANEGLDCEGMLCLGVSANHLHYPYSLLAYYPKKELAEAFKA